MANIRAAVDKVLGLGIRKDIFALPDESDLVDHGDNHQQDNRFAIANHDAEDPSHNIAPVPAPVPHETHNLVDLDSAAAEFGLAADRNSIEETETKCDKKMLADMMVRCNFCPEPGMINIAEKLVHQGQHQTAFFKCAACSGKRKFETFAELVEHIHSLHQVTDSEMVLETIILPTIENGLKMFKCGVKNCGKEFSALPERALLSHMEIVHGAYYIKVGKGKYLLRQCRICGDVIQFSSDQELTKHIAEGHPSNQFGEQIDSDGEDVQETTNAGVKIKTEMPDPDIEELSSNVAAASRSLLEASVASASPKAAPPVLSSRHPSAASSPGPSTTKKKKEKKSKKQQSSSSESSSSSSEDEYERKRKKKKKKAMAKKLKMSKEEKKWKKKIKSFTPEELMEYLKEMKAKKKMLKDKDKVSTKAVSYVPDPKAKFLEILNGKPTHFYCLICSIYAGKLSTWMDHRASYQHVEMFSHTKELAMKRFDCGDIDVQECVIGEKKFTVEPSSQCRECLQIFWDKEEIKTHLDLEDGKCLKLKKQRQEEAAAALALSPARSPSPNIIWKPLPKPEDIKGKKWRPVGQEETRRVYEKSPSPQRKSRVSEVNIPKYLLDGKTAYYICKLCKVPVGTILQWMEHKQSMEHKSKYRSASITEKMNEMFISHSTSVLHMFGDECNKCLACDANFTKNSTLETHEQTEAHRAASRRKELVDRNEVKNYGSNLSTLYYCDVCAVTTSDNPRDHLGTEEHVNRLNQTSKCQYCPRRIDKGIRFAKHQEEFHPDKVFACKKCPSRFAEGGVLLEHAYIHLNRMIHSYDELLSLNMFTIPSDLRKMECGSCPDIFIGQDVSDVTDHMLLYHPDILQSNMAREIEYSCLFCTQHFFDEHQMYDHVKNRHKMTFDKGVKSSSESPSPLKRRIFSESASSSPSGLQQKLLGLSGTKATPQPVPPPAPASASRVAHARRPTSNAPWSPKRRSRTRSLSSSRSRSRTRSPVRRRSRTRTPSRRKSRSPPRRYSRSRSRSRSPWSRRRSRTPRRTSSIDYRKGGRLAGWRSPSPRSRRRSRSPPKKIEVIGASSGIVVEELTKEQREEQVREESRLLNNLKKNLVAKKATLEDDLRDKIECKKIKMLDSRNECVKMEKLEGEGSIICPFCVKDCKSDEDLMNHMKLRHRDDMFGCSKCARGSQPAVAWSIEVLLQHLAHHHELNVTISEAISSYVNIPGNLHRINCKLCLPPYLLGTEGFWVGSDLQQNMEHIESHFERVHGMTDKSQVVGKLELACRGCDATFGHSSRGEWLLHLKKNHERLNRPDKVVNGPTKRCDYCGDNIVQTETIRHIKESHRHETFQCKACLEVDPACFPYSDTIKEMMQHMVMKHGDQFSSYYDHMVYPATLYGSLCSGDKCGHMVTAFDAATIGKHLRGHQDSGGNEVGIFYCRCCDRIKEKFKVNYAFHEMHCVLIFVLQSIDEVKNHIAQRHKSIVKWKAVNGNS